VPLILKTPAAAHHGAVINAQAHPLTSCQDSFGDRRGRTGGAERRVAASLIEQTKTAQGPNRALFGETDYPLRWGWAPLRALRADNTKLIEAPRPELYDLQPIRRN